MTTGRRCEGPSSQRYRFAHDLELANPLVAESKATEIHGDHLLSTLPGDSAERQAFNTYLVVAAPILSGTFDANLWYQLIPQLCHSEPAVWNAVLAISHFFVRERQPRDALQKHVVQATTWYGKSIKSLKVGLNQHPDRPAIALLSCILFVCVEEQLSNVVSGMSLMDQGVRLLVDGVGTNGEHAPLKSSAVWDVLLPFFTRHAILAATLGQPLPLDLRNRIVRYVGANWWSRPGYLRHVILTHKLRDMGKPDFLSIHLCTTATTSFAW